MWMKCSISRLMKWSMSAAEVFSAFSWSALCHCCSVLIPPLKSFCQLLKCSKSATEVFYCMSTIEVFRFWECSTICLLLKCSNFYVSYSRILSATEGFCLLLKCSIFYSSNLSAIEGFCLLLKCSPKVFELKFLRILSATTLHRDSAIFVPDPVF
jgi:hypothetical protein